MEDREQVIEMRRRQAESPGGIVQEEPDTMTALYQRAAELRTFFDALQQAGFTRQEALQLIARM